MYLPEFTYSKPDTINEVFHFLKSNKNTALIAGGTDILVESKQGRRQCENIISLNGIESLKNIQEKDDEIIIGSCVTFSQIEKSTIIKKYLPALSHAVSTIGTHQIRNIGTVGGNLCTCASCADSAPILIILDADIEIGSENSTRTAKLESFFVGHHLNALQPREILLNLKIKKPHQNFGAHFEKFGLRESASISVASVAASVLISKDVIVDANIIIGACGPTPMKSISSINELLNKNISDLSEGSEQLKKVGTAAEGDVLPIDDIRASADYRRNIVNIITQRVVLKAINNASETGK